VPPLPPPPTQVRFWSELANEVPSQAALEEVATDFKASVVDAVRSFEQLLAISPRSVESIRAYAVFASEVLNDPVTSVRLHQVHHVHRLLSVIAGSLISCTLCEAPSDLDGTSASRFARSLLTARDFFPFM
jgi:hypothetical protein